MAYTNAFAWELKAVNYPRSHHYKHPQTMQYMHNMQRTSSTQPLADMSASLGTLGLMHCWYTRHTANDDLRMMPNTAGNAVRITSDIWDKLEQLATSSTRLRPNMDDTITCCTEQILTINRVCQATHAHTCMCKLYLSLKLKSKTLVLNQSLIWMAKTWL